ncbi:MAG: hypothetical protein LBD94_03180 [Rickettsiales bacterium]|jgi:hypothetical protein|nr:hypothetical protein [Rickettsiales bacterium]
MNKKEIDDILEKFGNGSDIRNVENPRERQLRELAEKYRYNYPKYLEEAEKLQKEYS